MGRRVFKKCRKNDPMFLMKNTLVQDYLPNYDKPTNTLFSEFDTVNTENNEYKIKLRFSHLCPDGRKAIGGGTSPGGTPVGENLYKPNIGISLLTIWVTLLEGLYRTFIFLNSLSFFKYDIVFLNNILWEFLFLANLFLDILVSKLSVLFQDIINL